MGNKILWIKASNRHIPIFFTILPQKKLKPINSLDRSTVGAKRTESQGGINKYINENNDHSGIVNLRISSKFIAIMFHHWNLIYLFGPLLVYPSRIYRRLTSLISFYSRILSKHFLMLYKHPRHQRCHQLKEHCI